MHPDLPVSSIFQDASFALFEQLRAARELPLDRAGTLLATCVRAIDPAARGLAFTANGDSGLELQLVQEDASATAWVHAMCDMRGPCVSVYFTTERPTLSMRFDAPPMVPLEDGRLLLRERLAFSSHDERQDERKAIAAGLARTMGVPMMGGFLHIGTWDALDRSWQPETARRFLAAAVLLERTRRA